MADENPPPGKKPPKPGDALSADELSALESDMDTLREQLSGTRVTTAAAVQAAEGEAAEGGGGGKSSTLAEFYRFGALTLRQRLLFFDIDFKDYRTLFTVFPGQLIMGPTQLVQNVNLRNFIGKNAVPDAEAVRLFAARGGFVRWVNNKIVVDPVKEFHRSLARLSKPLEIDGSVVVFGSIQKGSEVKVTGNLYVMGDIEGAQVSVGGELYVWNGIVRRAGVEASGGVFCDFVDRAEVKTNADLWCKMAICNARVRAAGKIVIFDPKQAGLTSGTVVAGREISVAQIGQEGQKAEVKIDPEIYKKTLADLRGWFTETIGKVMTEQTERSGEADLFAIDIQSVMEFIQTQTETPTGLRVSASRKVSKNVRMAVGDAVRETSREEGAGSWGAEDAALLKLGYEPPEYVETPAKLFLAVQPVDEDAAFDQLAKFRLNVTLPQDDSSKTGLIRALLGQAPGKNIHRQMAGLNAEDPKQRDVRVVLTQEGDMVDRLAEFFEINPPPKKMRVTCDNIAAGLDAASSKLDIPANELEYTVIQEKSDGMFGIAKRPYILEVFRKDLAREELAKIPVVVARPTRSASGSGEAEKDAKYILENTLEGLFLTVYAAEAGGKGVDARHVLAELKTHGYTLNVSEAVVRTVVEEGKGERIRVADRQPEAKLDGKFEIKVSADKFKAELLVTPPKTNGLPVNAEQVQGKVNEMGIRNVELDKVQEYLARGEFDDPLVISQGKEAQDGQDARIEYLFLPKTGEKLKEDEYGRVDFRSLSAFKSVKEGELLAKKHAIEQGVNGYTVFGDVIQAKGGKDVALTAGKNVQMSPDGTEFYAVTSGHVIIHGRAIKVDNILEHKGNVDYEVGNINFDGTVIVRGAIEEGFVVKATGDIFVEAVSRGFAESGGNLVVDKGIIGSPDAHVRAEGDITAKFVENANIFCGGNVLVSEAILHSSISARENIVLRDGKRSIIVGGIMRAGGSVEAKVIGSEVSTKTVVEVGYDPTIRSRIEEIELEVEKHRKSFDSVKQGTETLNKLREKYGALPPDKEELLRKLVSTARNIAQQIRLYQKELIDLNRRLHENKPGIISGKLKIMPGTTITIMNYSLHVDKDYSNVRFYLDTDTDEIRFGEFKEVEI